MGLLDSAVVAAGRYADGKKSAKRVQTGIGRRVLLMVNGGLGDGVALTPTATALKDAGWEVHIWPIRGNCTLLTPLWDKIGVTTHDSRCDAMKLSYKAVCCPTAQSVLQDRAKGFEFDKLTSPRSHRLSLVEIAFDIARQLGVTDDPKPAPFAKILEPLRNHTPDLVLVGCGVGRQPEAQAKKYDHWKAALDLCSIRPLGFIWTEHDGCDWFKDVRYVHDFTGPRTSIIDLLPILARGRLYVGVDNGLGHLAAACGIKTITIFREGVTKPELYMPLHPQAKTLTDPLPMEVAQAIEDALPQDDFEGNAPAIAPTAGYKLSVILTAHNEWHQVGLTWENVRKNAGCPVEIVVVDEGSTDGSCDNLPDYVKVVRRPERTGVAPARMAGVAAATGDAFLFLDAHQRVGAGTPAHMLAKVMSEGCIVVAPMNPLYSGTGQKWYGSRVELKKGSPHSVFIKSKPKKRYSRCTAFVAPGWAVSRKTFEKIGGWARSLRGWGHTEQFMSTAAFFAGVPIYCDRELDNWHLFRQRFPYDVEVNRISGNALTLTRTLFDKDLFQDYWSPNIIRNIHRGVRNKWIDDAEMKADAIWFALHRRKTDRDYFNEVLEIDYPAEFTFEEEAVEWWDEIKGIVGKISQEKGEALTILRALHNIRPQEVLEIGTGFGGMTMLLSRVMQPGGRMVTVDKRLPDSQKEAREKAQAYIWAREITPTFLHADSMDAKTAKTVSEHFQDENVTVILFDGGHQYDTIKREWELYAPMIEPGGVALFHDITPARHGVRKFFDEISPGYKRTCIVSRRANDYGYGIIQVPYGE